jgi:energy-coupling factor transporter ATP-binding protein EcfA2
VTAGLIARITQVGITHPVIATTPLQHQTRRAHSSLVRPKSSGTFCHQFLGGIRKDCDLVRPVEYLRGSALARSEIRQTNHILELTGDCSCPAAPEWPFIGLRPYQEEDEEYFFGREEELNVLKPKVEQNRFVAIVGSSGCGKSSLIRAGLRAKFKKDPDGRWHWIEMRPGDRPMRELAKQLACVAGDTGDLTEAAADRFEQFLAKSSFGIGEALSHVPVVQTSESSRILLLVDQFEELFRFANLRSEGSLDVKMAAERWEVATGFVRLLLVATKSEQVPIHVMVTMRSDFIGDCARFHGLLAAVSGCQFLVPGMTRDQRADAICGPVDHARGLVDAELVQRALNATTRTLTNCLSYNTP